jgi:hypothetical protein
MDTVFAGRKILAIRIYRQATNSSLVDAKNFIEALEVRLRQESAEKFSNLPGKACCSGSAILLLAIAAAVYIAAQLIL